MKDLAQRDVTTYRWDDIPVEPLNELLGRKMITGERTMLASVL